MARARKKLELKPAPKLGTVQVTCGACDGTGRTADRETCYQCGGDGDVVVLTKDGVIEVQ